MILKVFFDYYFNVIDEEVMAAYKNMLPGEDDYSLAYEKMFSQNNDEAISFLLKFHRETAKIREEKPDQAILFNVNNNVCFPFFIEYIWNVMEQENKDKVIARLGSDDIKVITRILSEEVEHRNWFREEIGSKLSQQDLFIINEIIALQNFSSGGEYSFLKFVYPYIKELKGKILDAGCGAGFASLVMSQYSTVYAIDACRARLERAIALSTLMKKGEKTIFPQVINLIEEELGGMAVYCEFPSSEDLLAGNSQEVHFTEGSIDALSFEENFFDSINCLDVLEHTYAPEKIIQQFARVLKPGGRVYITAPTRYGELEQRIHESIEGTLFPAMLHMHHFDPESLNNLFSENGFKEVEVVPFDFMTWEAFLEIADRSPDRELAAELRNQPFHEVALQLFAVYEKI